MNDSAHSKHEVRAFPDGESMFQAAAEEFTRAARTAVEERGDFFVALSGGATPRGLYALLADPFAPYRDRVPWDRVHVFFSDERFVPLDSVDSNFRMARESLLSRVPIPAARIHPVPVEKSNPAEAAKEYERLMERVFQLQPGVWPRFDFILLGMGADGHTASLFPGSALCEEKNRKAAACHVPKLDTHRVSMTFPLINHARRIFLLAMGKEKAKALRSAIEGFAEEPVLPVHLVAPIHFVEPIQGRASWFVDEAAASLLS